MDEKKQKKKDEREKCFVIMPISDPEGYRSGHFRYVYEDIFKPAIEDAGFEPKRADDDDSSSMIHVNIIKDIIESPMAICDLSSRNPNVLFELGIRQAFDLPVVLVQERGTPKIFDISTINTIDYRNQLIYREVIEDREKISEAIKSTKDNKSGVNSIIRLLDIAKAKFDEKNRPSELDDIRLMMFALSNQISEMKKSNTIIVGNSSESSALDDNYSAYLKRYKMYVHKIRGEEELNDVYECISDMKNELDSIMSDDSLRETRKNLMKKRYLSLIDIAENKGLGNIETNIE